MTAFPVGIIGYGAYVPSWRLDLRGLAAAKGFDRSGRTFPLLEKSMPGQDEDTITMSVEAARNALRHAGVTAGELGAVWLGTESKPYAVKPGAVTVAEALGVGRNVSAADVEFACKAGTEALRAVAALVAAGLCRRGLVIGMDAAQARPGDELEATAAAGGAAFVIGPVEVAIARIEADVSYVSDTPDFFRRDAQVYPEHGGRFTGEPAYFQHTLEASRMLMAKTGLRPADFAFAVFHQPTPAFPRTAARRLGFEPEQLAPSLEIGDAVGNTYAGNWPLGVAATLDVAAPGDRVLAVSYGSGAGADAFCLRATERIIERRTHAPPVREMVQRRWVVMRASGHRQTKAGLV